MSSNQEHVYPVLSLSAAWRILGGESVANLNSTAGTLLKDLQAASSTRKVRAWAGDQAYAFDPALAQSLSGLGLAAAASSQTGSTGAWEEEQRISPQFYQHLAGLPVAIQEDNEFWLYITCVLLLPLLLEHAPVNKQSRSGKIAGKHLGTPKQAVTGDSDGSEDAKETSSAAGLTREQRANDILAKRMFLRGRIAATNSGSSPRAYSPLPNASEAESSHILTGRTVRQHEYAEKLTERLRNAKPAPSQDDLRKIVAFTLNVRKATKVVETLTANELDKLFKGSGL